MAVNQNDRLFLALANGELDKFLVGEPFYFFETKDDNDDPQNVVVAFDLLILPYWWETRDPLFPKRFADALLQMLKIYPDPNRAIYMVHRWIWYYQSCLSEKRMKAAGLYTDIFEIDLTSVASVLKDKLEANKADLITDTRWAGAVWNSKNGLWDPLVRTAMGVRDKLGGPDFVPSNV